MKNGIRMKPRKLSAARRWTALAVILLGQFVVTIDLTVLNIALPDLSKELNPTSDQLLWIVDVYSLVLAGLIVAASALSDRIGRKKALLTGFFIFVVGSLLVLFVDDARQLIALRAALGVGGALIMPITIAMVRNIFTNAKERALAIAAWSAAGAVGMAAGPLIGGFLLEHTTWHAAFLVNVPLMGTAFVAGIFALPEVKLAKPGKLDLLATLLALVGMVALMWGIKHMAAELAFDARGIVAVVAGVVFLALFVARCLTAKEPLVDLTLFRSKVFTAGVVGTLACTFAMAMLLYLLSQWLQVVNGDTSMEAGIHLLPLAAASLVSSAGAAWLATKFEARNVITCGIAFAGISMIALVLFRDNLSLVPVIAISTLAGLGQGALAVAASLMMVETPDEKASSAGSLQEMSYDMGNVLGVAILGSLASIAYRDGLSTSKLTALGLDRQTIDAAEQSIAAAYEIGREAGLPEILRMAENAFNDSLVLTCVAGGVIILESALVVWALVPKGLRTDGAASERAIEDADAALNKPKKKAKETKGAKSGKALKSSPKSSGKKRANTKQKDGKPKAKAKAKAGKAPA
ncbi:MAG: MFS transporter [Eggerthellaceae bacterium]|nr:MFS transporter [Eggerthellaceae bacterium]